MARNSKISSISEAEVEMIEEAFRFVEIGDPANAAQHFLRLSEMWPEKLAHKVNHFVMKFRQKNTLDSVDFLNMLKSVALKPGLGMDQLVSQNPKRPLLCYNIAMLLFHQQKYNTALIIVVQLRERITNYERLSKRLLLLHIDILLKLQEFERAQNVVEHHEVSLQVTEQSFQQPSVSADVLDSTMKIRVQQYKTQCFLSTKSLRNAKRECKLLFAQTGTNHPSLHIGACLKAHHDYLRGNYKKACKTVTTYQEEIMGKNPGEKDIDKSQRIVAMMLKNNEACCEFKMEKPRTATVYFSKASQEYGKLRAEGVSLPETSQKLLYNFAVSLVHVDPAEAFDALLKSMEHYYENPRLWLRLAEACISKHQNPTLWHYNWNPENKPFLSKYVGQGKSRQIQLPIFSGSRSREDDRTDINGTPMPTLEYAHYCLENALVLIKPGLKVGYISVKPSNPITDAGEIISLYAAILCTSAYVSLERENYPLAIARCSKLLSLNNVPSGYIYLANLYLGTAYFEIGDVRSSIGALFSEMDCDLNFRSLIVNDGKNNENDSGWPVIAPKSDQYIYRARVWQPKNLSAAQQLLGYHQIMILAKDNQFERAINYLKIWQNKFGKKLPLEFIMLNIYLHIKMGDVDMAVDLLKLHQLIMQ